MVFGAEPAGYRVGRMFAKQNDAVRFEGAWFEGERRRVG
jgi:hypothetical protein